MHEKAAALLHSLVRNHALIDGNKRLGWLAAVVFLDINGLVLDAPDDPAYDLVIAMAERRISRCRRSRLSLAGWTELVAQ